MVDLREGLLKAGIVDKKTVRQAEHQQRVERKEKGREVLDHEKQEKEAALEAQLEDRRRQDREREAKRQEETMEQDVAERLWEIAREGAVREGLFGNRRFHFVSRDGHLPFVEMSDDLSKRLEMGNAAIAELPGEEMETFIIITRETAVRMKEIDAESVRFYVESPEPRRRPPRRDGRGRPGGRDRDRGRRPPRS